MNFKISKNLLIKKTKLNNLGEYTYSGLWFFLLPEISTFEIQNTITNLKVGETTLDLQNAIQKSRNMIVKAHHKVIGNFKLTNLKNNQVQYLDPDLIFIRCLYCSNEAAIKTKITSDFYLTMSNVSRSDYYNIKFQKKPFMIWIWISAIMITLGGFIQLTSKKNED